MPISSLNVPPPGINRLPQQQQQQFGSGGPGQQPPLIGQQQMPFPHHHHHHQPHFAMQVGTGINLPPPIHER